MSGVEAKRPAKLGGAANRKRQRGRSRSALPESIEESLTARVPARSRFGSGHPASESLDPPHPLMKKTAAARAAAAPWLARIR